MPPNMLGLDLNGKAVNESQYKDMIGSQMNQTASRSDIQFSTDLPERHQVNIRNPTLVLLREFSAKAFENSKVFFSTPTSGIYGEVGVNTFRNAIGVHYLPHSSEYVAPLSIDIVRPWFKIIRYGEAIPATGTLKKSLLPPRWRLLMAQIIQCLEGKTGGFDQIANKDSIILYSLANGINIDYASIFGKTSLSN
ncbi:hypothetical protein Tco_0912887 [Tanacetum coccineum]